MLALRTAVLAGAVGLSAAFLPTCPPGLALKANVQPIAHRPRGQTSALSTLKMTPISTQDFKTGTTVLIDGNVYKVLEFLHVKPGKGSAFVRTKLKNLSNGGSLEKTFRAGESLEGAELTRLEMQFNYIDGDEYVFMDMTTFDTEAVSKDVMGDQAIWMKEGVDTIILKYGNKILDVSVPSTLSLEVIETEPSRKGNPGDPELKPATLEGGSVIKVPVFITTGEKINVDTVNKKYLSRDNSDSKKKM